MFAFPSKSAAVPSSVLCSPFSCCIRPKRKELIGNWASSKHNRSLLPTEALLNEPRAVRAIFHCCDPCSLEPRHLVFNLQRCVVQTPALRSRQYLGSPSPSSASRRSKNGKALLAGSGSRCHVGRGCKCSAGVSRQYHYAHLNVYDCKLVMGSLY